MGPYGTLDIFLWDFAVVLGMTFVSDQKTSFVKCSCISVMKFMLTHMGIGINYWDLM